MILTYNTDLETLGTYNIFKDFHNLDEIIEMIIHTIEPINVTFYLDIDF